MSQDVVSSVVKYGSQQIQAKGLEHALAGRIDVSIVVPIEVETAPNMKVDLGSRELSTSMRIEMVVLSEVKNLFFVARQEAVLIEFSSSISRLRHFCASKGAH